MTERKVQEELAAMRHRGARRRAKRGLVAGYIHELSARHRRLDPTERRTDGRAPVDRGTMTAG